jgi:hypothetical protein
VEAPVNRHEIPTHLNVGDKAFVGLTMRQLMTVAVGLGLSYGATCGLCACAEMPDFAKSHTYSLCPQ